MSTKSVVIQVPGDDSSALKTVSDATGSDVFETRQFDGETLAQLLLVLSPATIPIIRAWIRSRVDARKYYKIVIDGVEMSGYTAREVERLTAALDRAIQPGEEQVEGSQSDNAE